MILTIKDALKLIILLLTVRYSIGYHIMHYPRAAGYYTKFYLFFIFSPYSFLPKRERKLLFPSTKEKKNHSQKHFIGIGVKIVGARLKKPQQE